MSLMESTQEATSESALPPESKPHETSEMSEATTTLSVPFYRVKVYKCGDEGQWLDQGTGYVECTKFPEGSELIVRQEEPDAPLPEPGSLPPLTDTVILKSIILADDSYHRQQETLIVWTENDDSSYALSFQEAAGCDVLWEHIVSIQRELALSQPDKIEDTQSVDESIPAARSLDIPEPVLGNLVEIENIFSSCCRSVWGREQVVQYILSHDFLPKLLALLEVCEDLENLQDLYTLSSIMKMILMLNDSGIYEYIFREDVFLQVIGILEYDRDYPSKGNYRDHMLNTAKFKQVVPINHREIVSKINLTYRIQFLKDVVIARLMEDSIFSTLSSLIYFNQLEILTFIGQDHRFLSSVFDVLQSDATPMEKKNDVVLFLNELCTVAKSLPVTHRHHFYRSLGQHGLFGIFESILQHSDITIRLAAVSILNHLLDHDPCMMRSFCLAQMRQNQPIVLGFLIDCCIKEQDEGLQSQLCESLKVLLDTSKSELAKDGQGPALGADSEMDDFLNLFYEKYIGVLMDPILSLQSSTQETVLKLDHDRATLCHHLCELVSFAVKTHTYRSKYYVLGSNIMEKMCLLLKAQQSFVRLSALRFFRTCVGLKDEFYNRHLIKCDVFGPILTMFHSTQGRYNLLNSASLELFEFIYNEKQKTLLNHIVEKYRKTVENVTFIDTFTRLILKYDQAHEDTMGSATVQETPLAPMKKDGWDKVDKSEEDYFNTPDEESKASQDTPVTTAVKKPLVDYADDDETENESKPSTESSALPLFKLAAKQDEKEDDDEFPFKKRKLAENKIGFGLGSSKATLGAATGFIKIKSSSNPSSPVASTEEPLDKKQKLV